MIPKIIHYCWFGNNPLPELAIKCIESWKKYCPDYTIRQWDESNFDITSCAYVREAFEEQQWAFVSDYARLKVIYENGGIYLDTDVEIIRPIDDLLENSCFCGVEPTGYVATGLGFGAEKGNQIVGKMLDEYRNIHFRAGNGVYDRTGCPIRNTKPLTQIGFCYNGQIWEKMNVIVYPADFFCPMNRHTGEISITKNTYSIHHYSALWISDDEKNRQNKIDEIKDSNSKIIGKYKIHRYLYQELKKAGKTNHFLLYLWSKIKIHWHL